MAYSKKEVREFEEYLALAETGELQTAAKSLLGFKYNPYYTRRPKTVKAVADFIFPILPNLVQANETQRRIMEPGDIYGLYPEIDSPLSRANGDYALKLAQAAGIVTRSIVTGYHLTEEGLALQPYSVATTFRRGSGCGLSIAGGVIYGAATGALPGGDASWGTEVFNFVIGAASTSVIADQVHNIVDARRAYKISLTYPDAPE